MSTELLVTSILGVAQIVVPLIFPSGINRRAARSFIAKYKAWRILFITSGIAFTTFSLYRVIVPEPVSVANVELFARKWLDEFHFSIMTTPPDDRRIFALDVVLQTGRGVAISQMKDKANYLFIAAQAIPADQTLLDSFVNASPGDYRKVFSGLEAQLTLLRLEYATNQQPPYIRVTKRLPITQSLSQNDLLNAMYDVDAGTIAARNAFVELKDMRQYSISETHR